LAGSGPTSLYYNPDLYPLSTPSDCSWHWFLPNRARQAPPASTSLPDTISLVLTLTALFLDRSIFLGDGLASCVLCPRPRYLAHPFMKLYANVHTIKTGTQHNRRNQQHAGLHFSFTCLNNMSDQQSESNLFFFPFVRPTHETIFRHRFFFLVMVLDYQVVHIYPLVSLLVRF